MIPTPLTAMQILVVPAGTEITNDLTGEVATVTEDSYVVKSNAFYMTEATRDAVIEEIDRQGRAHG